MPSRQRVSGVRGPLYASESTFDEPRGLMMGKTNNPRERCTRPPPAMPSYSSPLEHRHTSSVLARRVNNCELGKSDCIGDTSAECTQLMAGMDSLEKQLTLLGAEKKRVEGELVKMPSSSGI